MEYKLATEAREIAAKIMEEDHPHLLGVRVEFLFMDKTPKSKGREVWGRAKKISGLNAFLALGPNTLPDFYADQPFDLFVIELSEEVWGRLTPSGRAALIDHELCHCVVEEDEETGEAKLGTKGHDLEEFESILRRHGLWRESLRGFVETGAEQLSFGGGLGGDGAEAGTRGPLKVMPRAE